MESGAGAALAAGGRPVHHSYGRGWWGGRGRGRGGGGRGPLSSFTAYHRSSHPHAYPLPHTPGGGGKGGGGAVSLLLPLLSSSLAGWTWWRERVWGVLLVLLHLEQWWGVGAGSRETTAAPHCTSLGGGGKCERGKKERAKKQPSKRTEGPVSLAKPFGSCVGVALALSSFGALHGWTADLPCGGSRQWFGREWSITRQARR